MMNSHSITLFLLLILSNEAGAQKKDSVAICIQTSIGDIHAVIYPEQAPVTCTNFLFYVDSLGDAGGEFYRTVTPDNQAGKICKIEVIQGGFNVAGIDTMNIKPIILERTNQTGVTHIDGTLSMARDNPDSGTTEFFICIGDQPSLDFGGARNPDGQGFGAFGRVIKGMEIVRKIQMSPSNGQAITPPVKINRIFRE
jgi:peptidyl-prolyl cis-trans isomerase A (cyclophilin A)